MKVENITKFYVRNESGSVTFNDVAYIAGKNNVYVANLSPVTKNAAVVTVGCNDLDGFETLKNENELGLDFKRLFKSAKIRKDRLNKMDGFTKRVAVNLLGLMETSGKKTLRISGDMRDEMYQSAKLIADEQFKDKIIFDYADYEVELKTKIVKMENSKTKIENDKTELENDNLFIYVIVTGLPVGVLAEQ